MMLNRLRLVNFSFNGRLSRKFLRRTMSDSTKNGILSVKVPNTNLARKKINELIVWYEQVTGMDEVRMMQNRVIEAQDKFIAAQESRRKLTSELLSVQNQLKDIQTELITTSRGEERYLQLVTEEHKILKDERRISREFSLCERDERDSFNILSSRLKESHEKERAQAGRIKYWSIVGSVAGTVLGIVGTSINNELRMRELRKLVESSLGRNGDFKESNALSNLLRNVQETIRQNTEHVVYQISGGGKQQEVTNYMQRIFNELKDLKKSLTSAQKVDGQLFVMPPDLEYVLEKQKKEIISVVIGVSLLAVISSIVFVFLQK